MSCIDYSIHRDTRLETLSATRYRKFFKLASFLDAYGDGAWSDDQLRRLLRLNKVNFAAFIDELIVWKFLRRKDGETGNLCRAGDINPQTVERLDRRHVKNGVSDSTLLDLRRELDDLRRDNLELREIIRHALPHLDLAEHALESPSISGQKPDKRADKSRTNPGQIPDIDPSKHTESAPNAAVLSEKAPESPRGRARPEESLSSLSLSPDSLSFSLDARERAEEIGCGEVYDHLHANGIPDQRIFEALTISWKQKGKKTPTLAPYVLGIARNLEPADSAECPVEVQKALDILIMTTGGAAPTVPSRAPTERPRARNGHAAKPRKLTEAEEIELLHEKWQRGECFGQNLSIMGGLPIEGAA